MKRTIAAISAAIVLLVEIFLVYEAFVSWMFPCEGIFQQSSVSLGTKLEIVKAKGESEDKRFRIGRSGLSRWR